MRFSLCALAICLALTGCGSDNKKTTTPTPVTPTPVKPPPVTPPPVATPDFTALQTSISNAMVENGATALSVAIMKDGEIIFAEVFGENFEDGTELSTETQFQLGSSSKMLTAMGVLKLEEKGILAVDDALVTHMSDIDYLPEYTAWWNDIQIHDLLSQQSGLVDVNDFTADAVGDNLELFATAFYPQEKPMTKAGQFYSYSNPNYVYLGALIERVSGQSFTEYMAENIFTPMGMNSTTFDKSAVKARGNYALGVDAEGNLLDSIDDIVGEKVGLAAGTGTWSTPTDILKMAQFLMAGNEQIMADAQRQKMTAKHAADNEFARPEAHYGYGIYVKDGFLRDMNEYYPVKMWAHGGNAENYGSQFYMFPEHNIAIAMMANSPSTEYEPTIVEALRTLDILPEKEAAPLPAVNPDKYAEYEGQYQGTTYWGDLSMEISTDGDALTVTIPELDFAGIPYDQVLHPMAGDSFMFNPGSDISNVITFRNMDDEPGAELISGRLLVLHKTGFQP